MGYHDRCFDNVPYLESKDPRHNNKRDKLTENAIKRYAETNPEYQKVLDKYYRPEKKLPRAKEIATKETKIKTKKTSISSSEVPMCSGSRSSSVSNSSEKLCSNCKQKLSVSKKNVTISNETKNTKNEDESLTYWKTKIDDDHLPSFPPRFPNECTSLILPAMFTEEEKRYYQSKQPKYPPVEKITSIIENKSVRPKPSGQYNIITGEELYETI